MDFGIYLRPEVTYEKMLKLALKAESLGFHGAFLNDHIHGFANEGKEPYVEAWTAMTGIGMQTSRLRIGQIVVFNSLRNPAYLAKSIATLDQMTNGRYELLLGSGWNESEYLSYDLMEKGRGMPPAKDRVDRFEETIQIIKNMLHNEVTNYNGKYWKLDNAINIPQPVQKPMRISVGCSKPRMMRITAKYASGINISGRAIPEIVDLIDKFASIAQTEEKKLTDFYISGFLGMQIAKDKESLKEIAKKFAETRKISIEQAMSDYFIGTAENLIDKLRIVADRGMKMMVTTITLDNEVNAHPLEYFVDNIVKHL